MKKTFCALLALFLLAAAAMCAAAEDNLIVNGGFSDMDGEMPVGWFKEMWLTDTGVSLLSVESDADGNPCAFVDNVDPNDARFSQTVAVEPNSIYRLSGRVWADACDTASYGATLSIKDVFVYSESKYDTAGQWENVELYGRTGPDQKTLTVFCRVGGYGTLGKGRGMFDDIELVKVDQVPPGVYLNDFFPEDAGDSVPEPVETDPAEPERHTPAWLLLTIVYVFLAVGFVRKRGRTPLPNTFPWHRWLWLTLAAAFVLRAVLALKVPGYNTDINCFSAWSERMYNLGPFRFYDPEYFCDYPPGYMLLLWPVALFRRMLHVNVGSAAYRGLLKLLPMALDVLGAGLVWRTARKKLSDRLAWMLAALYAFNPAAICNSAAWGQIDAVLTLFIALCALAAVEGQYFRALLWFTAALLIKPQALLFAPLGLVAIVSGIVTAPDAAAHRKALRSFLAGTGCCLAILYLAGLLGSAGQPAGPEGPLLKPVAWLLNQYFGAMQGYRYMTINTLNLYCLLGLNWAPADAHPVLLGIAWLLFGLSYAFTAGLYVISRDKPARLLTLGATLILLITTFSPMMHERYVFPALLLLMLAFSQERDVRLLASALCLTATLFLNEVLVLQGGMTAANYGHLQSSENWLNISTSVIVIGNALFTAWTAFDLCVHNHLFPLRATQPETEPAGQRSLSRTPDYRLALRRTDYLAMAAVTLCYSVLAFTNLGTTHAPQSGWTSSRSGEQVIFDLGETREFRMTYYGGICNTAFEVALSNDGERWTQDEVFARYNQGEIFRWLWFTPLDGDMQTLYGEDLEPAAEGVPQINTATMAQSDPMQTARYVRLTAESAGLNLLEVGFLDADGKPWPVVDVTQQGQTEQSHSDARALVDEQDTVPPIPTYLNSTYFDEIYHARTAYEFLHGMNVYEWTHPPLGKAWMMLGIQLFGVTPFGWRFMGALAGVLMLPVLYLLVKQLTKDSRLALIAMSLLALDSMHFTQTRIATIDSFGVFWILVMYLFMIRYCQMSWNHVPLRRTLVPLGLCGVTMGIACATKWIGIYASVGLAVLFFWTLYRRLRESRYIEGENPTLKNTFITLGFCLVFFVAVPLLIYYFSYYWHLRGEGLSSLGSMLSPRWVRRVVEIQKNIFSYHSSLGGDTHHFRSPWYQWPVIWWPMWYYTGTAYLPQGMISSISCMGNPAVWWFGLFAIVYVFVRSCVDRRASRTHVVCVIGFASQFLPWVLVPRSTFIYHYFASVPFIIIASVLVLRDLRRRSPRAYQAAACTLLACAAALFIAFYPLESGLPCPRSYAKHLRWFKWLNY